MSFRRGDPVNPLDSVLRDAKQIGFDGVELMLDPDEPLGRVEGPRSSQDVTPELREGFRESSERHGVEIATLSDRLGVGLLSVRPRLDQWDRGVELIQSDLELARDLGAKAILMHVGHSKGSWEEVKSIVARCAEHGGRGG